MLIRSATLSDLTILRKLEQGVVTAERPFNSTLKEDPVFYCDIEQLITSEESNLLVVVIDDEIIASGYSQIRNSKPSLQHDKHAYLGFMYVSELHRGKGINARLVDELISWSKSQGIYDFYLDVYSENSSAIKAYEKAGFQPSLLEMKLNLND